MFLQLKIVLVMIIFLIDTMEINIPFGDPLDSYLNYGVLNVLGGDLLTKGLLETATLLFSHICYM